MNIRDALQTKRPFRIVLAVALLSMISGALGFGSAERSIVICGKEYRQRDGEWFKYINGRLSDRIVPHRLILRLKDKGDVRAFPFEEFGIGGVHVERDRVSDELHIAEISNDVDPIEVARRVGDTGFFDFVDFDCYGRWYGQPDDEYYSSQWNLHSDKLDAEHAWDYGSGDSSLVIAIIDSGTDYYHEDLIDNIWVNPGEDLDEDGEVYDLDDLNSVDDDNNGYIDDLVGWDFYGEGPMQGLPGAAPPERGDNTPSDTCGHGTWMAGVAAARTDNNKGVAGVAGGWSGVGGSKLMILRIGRDWEHTGEGVLAAKAVRYAVRACSMGVKVRALNMSFGWDSPQGLLNIWLQAAVKWYGIVPVAAAGDVHWSPYLDYPARAWHTIAVGATDEYDMQWYEQGHGSPIGPAMEVVAPTGIYTTDITGDGGIPGDYFANSAGTSSATAEVSGLVALMHSVNDTLWKVSPVDSLETFHKVRRMLRDSADKVPDMGPQPDSSFTVRYGYGRVNCLRAILKARFDAEFISGDPITTDTTWPTTTHYPNVYLEGDVSIDNGATLTIRPGTRVFFEPDAGLRVYDATLVADASGREPIEFTSGAIVPEPGDWAGVFGFQSGQITMKNCVVSYSSSGVSVASQYNDEGTGVKSTIDNVVFEDNLVSSLGLYGTGLDPVWAEVRNCVFEVESPYGLYCETPAESVTVRNCSITGTSAATYGVYICPVWLSCCARSEHGPSPGKH